MKYQVQWDYRSSIGGPWKAGDVVALHPDLATAINYDSPVVLKPYEEAPQDLSIPLPGAKDRMTKTANRRGGKKDV